MLMRKLVIAALCAAVAGYVFDATWDGSGLVGRPIATAITKGIPDNEQSIAGRRSYAAGEMRLEEASVSSVNTDQHDFAAGFEAGYRAIKGTAAPLPVLSGYPSTRGNTTPFLLGVRRGLETAGLKID